MGLMYDLRYSLRVLRRQPVLTTTVILALGLGIGANTAIFSLTNALLLKPLPGVHEASGLVGVGRTQDGSGFDTFGYPGYLDLEAVNSTFENLVAVRARAFSMGDGATFQRVGGAMVSGNYFEALGVRASSGRLLTPDDDVMGAPRPVAVLSEGLARDLFGTPEAAVGQELTLNGVRMFAVGVAGRGFRGTSTLNRIQVWVPISLEPLLWADAPDLLEGRQFVWLNLFGRLREGVSAAAARDDLGAILDGLRRQWPEIYEGRGIAVAEGLGMSPGLRSNVASFTGILSLVVLLVLIIACANVANLLLVRSSARDREMGIRLAVGGGRGRIVRQLLTESLLLALGGGAAAMVIAVWGSDLLRIIVGMTPLSAAAGNLDYAPDLRVLLFTLALSLFAAIGFGLFPALASAKTRVTDVLRPGARRSWGRGSRLRAVLVSGQLAISVILLAGAGLYVRTLMNYGRVDPGFDADRVAAVSVALEGETYPEPRARAFMDDLLDRVERLPGVEAAGYADPVPLEGSRMSTRVQVPGLVPPEGRDGFGVDLRAVTPDYLDTMGIPIVTGRGIANEDRQGTRPVAVVNQTMAERLWPDGALGKTFTTRWFSAGGEETGEVLVVGISRDSKYLRLDEAPRMHMYLSYWQSFSPETVLHLRTDGDPAALFGPVRDLVRQMDPNLPLFGFRTLEEQVKESYGNTRAAASVAGLFALLALVLAVIGLFGALSYSVKQRSPEIGVRIALGAKAGDVERMVIGRGLLLVAGGIVPGLIGALVAGRLLASEIYGIAPWDPLTLAAALAVLLITGFLASWIPSRRAARVDPVVALRSE